MANKNEILGPAEHIINTLIGHADHLYHGRPGMVTKAPHQNIGVLWEPVTHKEENGKKIVYKLTKIGKKLNQTRVGELRDDLSIVDERGKKLADYRPAGIFPEVAAWMYEQVAQVWKLDNEFAAKWASYAYKQDHRDLKVVLAAFMLCQSRCGEPIRDKGEVAFYDDDYRDIGEAMMLLYDKKDSFDLNPKQLLRIHDLLSLPAVAEANRKLGFGRSPRNTFYGRWTKAVEKWLQYREENPKLLEGLVKAGFRQTVMDLARRSGYKPSTDKFFEILRWKQKQAKDGHRSVAIGKDVAAAESWENLSETQICERIVQEKPNFKRIVSLIPKSIGLTRAIMTASIEAGALSNKDLIIATPTLEDLGLLEVQSVKEKWSEAIRSAEDQRAANIAKRVKNKDTQEQLQEASDNAAKKAVEEVMKGIRVYFFIDISGSMEISIELAKTYLEKLLPGFLSDLKNPKIHVATFNTTGKVITFKQASTAGVVQAFKGISAGGGTDHGSGVRALAHLKPKEDEDVVFMFVGDEGQYGTFTERVKESGLNPVAFGLIKVGAQGSAIRDTAVNLGIPCFMINENTFSDPYSVPRVLRNLIASTPVGQKTNKITGYQRVSLVDTIIATPLLTKPVWAA